MRQSVAFLVVLMVMLACFAVLQIHPPALVRHPGNFVVAAALLFGAVAVALRRPYAYQAGLLAALVTSLGGLLSLRGWFGTVLPQSPIIWIVAGLYLGFRLVMNQHAAQLEAERAQRRKERRAGERSALTAPAHLCYRHQVHARALVLLLWPLLSLLASCNSASTPERACEIFIRAVREGDPAEVFAALLQNTQWSLHTVARQNKEMAALIRRDYPQREQAQALGRLDGGGRGDGRDLLRAVYKDRYAHSFEGRLGAGAPSVQMQPDGTATCVRLGGQPYRFAPSPAGRWGLSELDGEWELAKVRAIHDLDTVRQNGRLYKQAQP